MRSIPLKEVILVGAAVLVAGFVGACSEVLEPGPLQISVSVEPASVAVGEEVQVHYEASGRSLQAVAIDFGDGHVESVFGQGAQKVDGRLPHSYDSAGNYLIRATVTETVGETAFAEAVLEVVDP